MSAPLPPLVLGLCGPAGAGKGTAAAYLQDAYAFVPIAFADPLLDMLGATFEDYKHLPPATLQRMLKMGGQAIKDAAAAQD